VWGADYLLTIVTFSVRGTWISKLSSTQHTKSF